ncbi:hypothetical protein RJ640_007151 [Escallonia rubra]|uniref:Uncharacterized protein n=1 Tax=Escallonia rubra TaxID=112253 RepID=A0AA88QYX1_9ASTE|nr:hypothetical protein RJ640_007151 [Escallonia rubra]
MTMSKLLVHILKRSLSFSQTRRRHNRLGAVVCDEELNEKATVPRDVKEGHFAVFAVKGDEPKRFVLELGYLRNPSFLRLLKQAEEEYGHTQKGALAVPCRPEELHKILQHRRERNAIAGHTCNAIIRKSC